MFHHKPHDKANILKLDGYAGTSALQRMMRGVERDISALGELRAAIARDELPVMSLLAYADRYSLSVESDLQGGWWEAACESILDQMFNRLTMLAFIHDQFRPDAVSACPNGKTKMVKEFLCNPWGEDVPNELGAGHDLAITDIDERYWMRRQPQREVAKKLGANARVAEGHSLA
ncbi:MAG: hypothetical protein H6922_00660 [Pseudomonadaceae bacterium]|nr:hypothetical protein [Pseudomonadaceae bacterium]